MFGPTYFGSSFFPETWFGASSSTLGIILKLTFQIKTRAMTFIMEP